MIKTNHKILLGDSRKIKLEKESVHLVITSPPYWDWKDYGIENQIGYGQSYEEYLTDLGKVFLMCKEALHKGGKMCINIADLYESKDKNKDEYKVIPLIADTTRVLTEIGLIPRGTIIWNKIPNCNPKGGGSVMGSYPYPRNGIIKYNYEGIIIAKKRGKDPSPTEEIKEASKMRGGEWLKFFSGIWSVNGTSNDSHPATFPLEIPLRLIKMFSFIGDTILDPFLGTGTTMKASRILRRNSIGIEINEEQYLSQIKKSVNVNNKGLFQDCDFQIIKDS